MLVRRFSRLLAFVTVGAVLASSAVAYARDKRQLWEHADRLFEDQGNGVWVETDRQGKLLFKFTEVGRNSDFIELNDSDRGYIVRLYANALHIKGGRRGDLTRFDQCTKLDNGQWADAPPPTATSIAENYQRAEVTVMPVFIIPRGEKPPTKDQISRFMRHLVIAQEWYKKALGNRDTFTLATNAPRIVQGKHPMSHYTKLESNGKASQLAQFTGELLDHFTVTRYNCPYIFACVVMNPTGGGPCSGAPINGGVNRGGGVAFMTSELLDESKYFQGICMHELGHSFGLVHPTEYGYGMYKIPNTIMAGNVTFKGWSGFTPPPKNLSILLPEDIRLLSRNRMVFPNLVFAPSKDVPSGYNIARPVYLDPRNVVGHASYDESIDYISVKNQTGRSVFVKVTKSCDQGQDRYFEIKPGEKERWGRCVYRKVTMKASRTNNDREIYASKDHFTMKKANCNLWVIDAKEFKYVGSNCTKGGRL